MKLNNIVLTNLEDSVFKHIDKESYIAAVNAIDDETTFGQMGKEPIDYPEIDKTKITHQISNPRYVDDANGKFIIGDVVILNDKLNEVVYKLEHETDFKIDFIFRAYSFRNSTNSISIDQVLAWDIQHISFRKEIYKYFKSIINNE